MRGITLLLSICVEFFLSFCVFAQPNSWYVKLSEQPIQNIEESVPRVLFFENTPDGYFVLREQVYRNFKRRKFIIERLDLALNSKSQRDITNDLDEQNFDIQDVLRLNDRLLLLSMAYQRDQKIRIFYLQELFYDSLELGPKKEVYRASNENLSAYTVELNHSPNEEKIMFSIIPEKRTPWIRKPENDFRDVVILNKDLTVFENIGRLEMRSGSIDFDIDQGLINNDGTLFFLAQKIPDKKSEVPEFYVLRYRKNTLEFGRLQFNEGQIKRARLDLNPDGNLLFMGYYMEVKRFNAGIGVVSTMFSKETLEPQTIHIELIRNEVMMAGLRERHKRKWAREIEAGRDLKLNQDIVPLYFFRHPSGQVSMVGEIQYVTIESTSLTQAGTYNRFTYNYEHIFITRIDPSGKILWTSKIPKLYRGSFDLVQSFHAIMHGENLNLIFNDNQDNLIPNPRKGIRYLSPRSRFNFLVNYSIDEKGKVENQALLEYNQAPFDKMNMFNLFTDAAQSSGQQLLLSTSGKFGPHYLLIGRNE